MEYRKLPRGNEQITTIGLGLANLYTTTDENIEETIRYGIDHGINFYDLCGGRMGVYEAFARASKGRRDQLYTQMHFGAVYEKDDYGFSRDLDLIKSSFDRVLKASGTDYTDFGYIHCIDEDADFEKIMNGGLWDYVVGLKEQGVVRHIGFSSHSPAMAKRFLETGMVDMFMFSINPAYDYTDGELAYGSFSEREEMYRMAQRMGVGISVMKPFAGGQLLDEKRSPLNVALTHNQCLQYALDRPGVLCCVPGVGSVQDVKQLLRFYDASEQERDYSILSTATPSEAMGRCVYCNHCAPCPMGINIGLVNKYYDLAKLGDELAAGHYRNLSIQADACVQCGHCEERCPFHVKQMDRMQDIAGYFCGG